MAKYTYQLQTLRDEKWVNLPFMQDSSLRYLRGYCEGVRNRHDIRVAHRIIRDDGKVVEEIPAAESVPLGMVAGFPTPEQYANGAARMLERFALAYKERDPQSVNGRILMLTSPPVLNALAPEHSPPRYSGNECSDEHYWNRRADYSPKEYSCLRCHLLLARDAVIYGSKFDVHLNQFFDIRHG